MTDNSALGEFILFIRNKEKNESLQAKGIYLDYSINREDYIDYKLFKISYPTFYLPKKSFVNFSGWLLFLVSTQSFVIFDKNKFILYNP